MSEFASSHIVNLTLWLLIGFSVIAWAIIFLKSWEQWRLQRANRAYTDAFWSAPSLAAAASPITTAIWSAIGSVGTPKSPRPPPPRRHPLRARRRRRRRSRAPT